MLTSERSIFVEQARIELLESSDPLHAMITTYNIAFQKGDRGFLKRFKFDYLVLGKRKKNREARGNIS